MDWTTAYISIVAAEDLPSDVVGPVTASMCSLTTLKDKQEMQQCRTKSYCNNYSLPAAIIPPMISVSRADSDLAVSRFVLIYNIALPTGVTVSGVPSVQWRRPSGGSATGTVFPVGESLYNSQLIFNPLTLSDGGDYTCTATYSLGGHTSPSHFQLICNE